MIESIDISRFLVSLGTDFNPAMAETYLDAVKRGFYISFNGLNAVEKNLVKDISKFIHNASSRNPVYATRIAVGFHEEPHQTSFSRFNSTNGGIGLSFLYPSFIMKKMEHGLAWAFNEFKRIVGELASYLEARGLGFS
jgi:hypothetical protein